MPAKFSDRNDWFDLWRSDKDAMIATMVSNLHADLEAQQCHRAGHASAHHDARPAWPLVLR